MPWTAPTFTGGINWQNAPSTLTPLNAADLNTEENAEATYAALVGQSVVNWFNSLTPASLSVTDGTTTETGVSVLSVSGATVSTTGAGEATITVIGPVGLSPTGGDDSSMFYTAIQEAFQDGGDLLLLNDGDYHINGPLLTVDQFGNSGYRTQIPIPYNPYSSSTSEIPLTIRGRYGGDHSFGFGTVAPGTAGATIISNSTGGAWDGGTTPSVFGGPNAAKGFTNVGLTFEDVHIRLPSNPNIAAIHAGQVNGFDGRRLTVDTTDAFGFFTGGVYPQPTHPSGVGVIMPQAGCENGRLENYYTQALYCGFIVGEHSSGDDILIQHNKIGIGVLGAGHSNHFSYVQTVQCPYHISGWDPTSGPIPIPQAAWNGVIGPTLDIAHWDIEDDRNVTAWQELQYHVYGAANLHGRLRYHIVNGNSYIPPVNWIPMKTDAFSFTCIGIPDGAVSAASRATLAANTATVLNTYVPLNLTASTATDPLGHFQTKYLSGSFVASGNYGCYVCPADGVYQATGMVGCVGTAIEQVILAGILHNGVLSGYGASSNSTGGSFYNMYASVSDVVYANAGDTIALVINSPTNGGLAVDTGNGVNYMSVVPLQMCGGRS